MNRRQERYYSIAPHITTATWITWEMKRHLAAQGPAPHGYFTAEDAK